jgi:succinoglycan biosynthesis protein ExoA
LVSGEKQSVTVVIACRNEKAHIGTLLESLACLDRAQLTLEAIIADGGSTDGTRAVLDDFCRNNEWCSVIDNPRRIVSTGLNEAIRQARGEFIVRMDAHTFYEPAYVVRSISILQTTGASNVGGPQRSRASGFWQRAIHAGFHSPFASGGARFRDDNFREAVDTVPYGCWRKDSLLSLGLFDETLVRNQDDELNMRIRLAGGVVWQDPSIVSWYSPRTTLAGLFRQYLQFGFWRVKVLQKHSEAAPIRHFVPAAAILVGTLLVCLMAVDVTRGPAVVTAIALVSLYLVLSVYASVKAARREGWDLLPALPVTFAVYQGAYAAGFCCGLLYWWSRRVPRLFDA